MSSSTPMWRLAAVLVACLTPSLAAFEPPHTTLRASEPAKDGRLATSPAHIALWFTAKPQLAFTRIVLAGPSGDVPLDTIVADTGNGLHARVPRPLGPGTYTVKWQTASADGHPIRGEFAFRIIGAEHPDRTVPVPVEQTPGAEPPIVPSVAVTEYRTARWLEFAALLLVLGALGFRHAVLPPLAIRGVTTSDASDRARRLGRLALIPYGIAVLVRLGAQSVALNGPAAFDAGTLSMLLTDTTWGIGWILGGLGAVLLFIGWSLPRRWARTLGTPLALSGALGMVLAPALSGHAAASSYFVPSVTLDALHVAAAGLWIGGLVMVLAVGIPAMLRLTDGNRDAAVRALLSSFHPLALFCAPIVVVAGLGTSWMRLGGASGLDSLYGKTLLIKLSLFAVVAAMGTYNAFRARRRLGTAEGTRHFRGTASVELIFAALVLIATTFLVVSPVPVEMTP